MVKKLPKDLDIFSLSTARHIKGIMTMLRQVQMSKYSRSFEGIRPVAVH